MKCVVCKQADTQPGVTTVTFERSGATEELARAGTQVDIRRYAAAA